MTPDDVRAWQSIFRDIVITVLAAFMLVFETVFAVDPNVYVIGAGLTLLGLPPALRLDTWRRRGEKAAQVEEDPYDGPGGYYRDQ